MKTRFLLFSLLMLGCISCEELIDSANFRQGLMGAWVSPVYENDSVIIFTRNDTLRGDTYGIQFRDSNKLTEHKNSGWCGTPPISYGNFNGIWYLQDSLISIHTPYWGGEVRYKWKIISLTPGRLTVKQLEVSYNNPD